MFLRLPRPVFNADPAPQAPDPAPPPPVLENAPAPDPAPEPTPAPSRDPPTWALQRISEETEARRAAEARAAAAEALIARQSQRPQPPPAVPGAPPSPPPYQQPVIDARAQAEQMYLDQARQDILSAGSAEFGSSRMAEIANIARACRATENDFIADIVAFGRGEAHRTLATLTKNPEELTRLASLPSRQRMAELAKMTAKSAADPAPAPAPTPAPAAPAPKGVSKAPPPAPPVTPAATRPAPNWRDDNASDAEFTEGFEKEFLARKSARR